MINFKSIPFLKILLPYVLGIVCTLLLGIHNHIHLIFSGVVSVFILSYLFQKYYRPIIFFKKLVFTISVSLFLFFLAQETCFFYKAKYHTHFYGKYVTQKPQQVFGVITDLPVYTSKYVKIQFDISAIKNDTAWHYCNGHTIIYLKDTTLVLSLGNTLFLNAAFNYVNEPQNPQEFNYKSFLENKNILHVMYAKQATVLASQVNQFSWLYLGTRIKANVVAILKKSGLSQQAFSVCAALLVGYDDEIDSTTMQSFSHSGTLHVLSVSGMHTGVLYGVFLFMFGFFDKHDTYKKTKCCIIILSLIGFSFITGLSPSVLRASLMLSLITIGNTFYKQGNAYNTLLLSAFLLLIVNPFLLVDVGFLLSYLAVFGIMYLNPILSNLYYFENKVIQHCWILTTMSVAATLFTLPVSLYVFHQFPIWFVFSNLIIIPISVGLMALSFGILCLHNIPFFKQALVFVTNKVSDIMMWVAQLTDNETYGYIDYIAFDKADVIFCFLSIYVGLIIIATKRYKTVVLMGVLGVVWLCYSLIINYNQLQQKELLVFSIHKKTAFIFRNGKTIYTYNKELTIQEYNRSVKPYLCQFSNTHIIHITTGTILNKFVNIIHVNHKQVKEFDTSTKYIIVSNNTPLELNHAHSNQLVIADCTNNYNFLKKIKKQCMQYDIPFYSVKESGALQIQLN